MKVDFRAFFLLVEIITEIRRSPIFNRYSYYGKLLFLSRKLMSRLLETIFFSIFQRLLILFNEILHSGKWKLIFCLVETMFFDQSYFSASGNHY